MPFQVAKHSSAEMRRAERDEVFYRTSLWAGSAKADGQLVNVSPLGFLIRCDLPCAVGQEVQLQLPIAGKVTAKAAWALGGRIGAEFSKPFEPSNYAALLTALRSNSRGWQTV